MGDRDAGRWGGHGELESGASVAEILIVLAILALVGAVVATALASLRG